MPLVSEQEIVDLWQEFDPSPPDYALRSVRRFAETMGLIPDAPTTGGKLLELGCDNYFTLLLRKFAGYDIRTQNLSEGYGGYSDCSRFIHKRSGEAVAFHRDFFDLEVDRFPYPDQTFDVVICTEIIEHLLHDPMAMLIETHRVLKPNGTLVLTTPNLIGWHGLLKGIKGLSPLEFSCFITTKNPPLLQHAKEYLPGEVVEMLEAGGFSVEQLTTPYFLYPHERFSFADWLLLAFITVWFPLAGRHPKLLRHRGPHIFVRARKTGTMTKRHPRQVYA